MRPRKLGAKPPIRWSKPCVTFSRPERNSFPLVRRPFTGRFPVGIDRRDDRRAVEPNDEREPEEHVLSVESHLRADAKARLWARHNHVIDCGFHHSPPGVGALRISSGLLGL